VHPGMRANGSILISHISSFFFVVDWLSRSILQLHHLNSSTISSSAIIHKQIEYMTLIEHVLKSPRSEATHDSRSQL
jgi:hypothetical protein